MKIRNIIVVIYIMLPILIYGTGGELFFKVEFDGAWTLKFEKLDGELYYDNYFNLANPPDYIFTKTGNNEIKGDMVFDDNGNGTVDMNGRKLVIYYGKFLVSISSGENSSSFIINYLDCDYNGLLSSGYVDVDTYFL